MSLNYGELASLTRRHFRTPVINQIKQSSPLLDKILSDKKNYSGTKIVAPIKFDHLNSFEYAPFNGANKFNIDMKEIHTAAEFETKGIGVNLSIDGYVTEQNKGKEAVANLVKEKVNDLTETMQKELAACMVGGINGNKPVGLAEVLKTDNVYGGIDRVTNAFWQPKIDAAGGALTVSRLNKMWVQVTKGGQEAKNLYIVVGFNAYNKIYDLIEAQYRKVDTEEISKIGMRAIIFNGTPIIADPYVQDDNIRFVNLSNFGFSALSGRDFYFTDFKPAQDTDTMTQQLLLAGNFVLDKAANQGIMTGLDLSL